MIEMKRPYESPDYLSGLKLDPAAREFILAMMADDEREIAYRKERAQADADLETLAKQYADEERERVKLYGHKFPAILGQVPESIDPPEPKRKPGRPRKVKPEPAPGKGSGPGSRKRPAKPG